MLQVGALLPAPVEPAHEPRKRTARVRQADGEPGKAVEYASEDKVRRGDRRFERIAEQVGEVIRTQALVADHLDRVQKKRQAARLDSLVHGEKGRVGQVLSANLRCD